MRMMFVKYASALLVLWYSLSIIGFDVHSCKITGEVFVASLAGGIACEDIHPDHSCKSHGGCCCGHHHGGGCDDHGHGEGTHVGKSECCTNDLQILELTGVYTSSQQRYADDVYSTDYALNGNVAVEVALPSLQRPFLSYIKSPDSRVVMPDRQAFFSIWRV